MYWERMETNVHEAGVEVGSFIGVWRVDVRGPTAEWVFEEVEHREELTRWEKHMVAEEAIIMIKLVYDNRPINRTED
jgi:hypothetical protein